MVPIADSVNSIVLQLLEITLLESLALDLAFVRRILEKPGFSCFFVFNFLIR